MTVTYSKKASGNKKLSENFTVSEFACKDGSDKIIIDTELVVLLQKIREHFKKPVTITSGYRNAAYNKKVGGAPNSQHCLGTAADIVISGVTPLEIAQYAEYLLGKSGGIGLYKSFTHVDVRKNRARWDNTSGKEVSVSGFPGYVHKLKNADEITWELNYKYFNIDDYAGFISALDKAKAENSPLYWGFYKLVNKRV